MGQLAQRPALECGALPAGGATVRPVFRSLSWPGSRGLRSLLQQRLLGQGLSSPGLSSAGSEASAVAVMVTVQRGMREAGGGRGGSAGDHDAQGLSRADSGP